MPNTIALGYTLIGYALGVWLLTVRALVAEPGRRPADRAHAGVRGLLHPRVRAPVASSAAAEANNRWGTLMTLDHRAAATRPSRALRRKHMRHHIDRADVLTFDYKACLERSPRWVQRLVLGARMGLRAGGRAHHARLRHAAALPQGRARERASAAGRDHRHPRRAVRPARLGLAQGAGPVRRRLHDHAARAALRRRLPAHLRRVRRARGRRHPGRQGARPRLRAGQHLLQPRVDRPSGAQPAAAQLRLPQRPSRTAHRALARPAEAARPALPRPSTAR